ncbi:MAG: Ppx/GppA family phosphatase [Acidobacteria bacterium]|nr:MAG: Ppx/GppA family phosphatase [Acidobacteriota bacterium]
MPRLGIVDLGSNTARLVVFSYEPGEWFRLVHQIREPVRLGEGLGRDGKITAAAMRRAELALTLFAQYASSTGLESLEILGTSALRDAANREELLETLRDLGFEITVLSGEQEARLGVLAVANGFDLTKACVIDLGGGSAQISFMRDRGFEAGRAYPLGGVRLLERFLQSDPPKEKEVEALEEAVAGELEEVAGVLAASSTPLVAMGGTIRNLARVVQRRSRYPLMDRIHGYFLEREALDALTTRLLGLKSKKRARISGIKVDRADVIVAGALVYRWLLRRTGRDGLWISGYGLREGAFFERSLPAPHLITDLRSFSVGNLLRQYARSGGHIDQVRYLASELFTELQPIHGFGAREAELLDAGAQLQNIGLAVNYYRHDRHGAYLVASAPLNGFTHRDQALVSLLVRYHLKGRPRLGGYRRLCRPDDKRLLVTLLTCLRIGEHLDRSRMGAVEGLRVKTTPKKVTVEVLSKRELSTELWELERHQDIFRAAFGRKLQIEPGHISR